MIAVMMLARKTYESSDFNRASMLAGMLEDASVSDAVLLGLRAGSASQHNPRERRGSNMTGYVHTINHSRGLVVIATEGHGFTIVELLGSDPIHLGDRLEWDDASALGSAVYHNRTKATRINVNVQTHGVLESRLRQRLRL
jgi:hypothetical protein